jgi:thiol:disulfide interchange protein
MILIAAGVALMIGIGARAQMPPIPSKHIYPTIQAAPTDIRAALTEARRTHKRVILDFGGDWCPDCQVLNIYFHRSPNAQLLAKYFILVDVNIGQMDANLNIAHKYGVPVKGVPALSVIDGNGKVVYAQNKEFDDMRNMQSSSVTEFLNKWKP